MICYVSNTFLDCQQSNFLSNMGRERRELRAKRDCDEQRLGRDRVCHAVVPKSYPSEGQPRSTSDEFPSRVVFGNFR